MAADETRTLHLVSLGCARNRVDSEEMLARTAGAGWVVTDDPADARAIVVNTCGFVESAVNESIDTILQLAAHRQSGRCRRLVVAGCLPERFREQLAETLPEVDCFIGTGAFDQIVAALESPPAAGACLLPDPDSVPAAVPESGRMLSTAPWAYLKIAEGCSRRCTYCIIPRLRGSQRSRTPQAVAAEAATLVAAGARELVLVAQDTTAYGSDRQDAAGLAGLLETLAVQSPQTWIRFLYGHPQSIGERVLDTVAAHDNICPYFDIPVQHASDRILRRMGRGSDCRGLQALFETVRARVPGAALRTTVIVGFPGEGEKEFGELEAFVAETAFDHLGVFVYSDFDDLPSHRLSDHVDPEIAAGRRDRLMRRQQQISLERNLRRVGTETVMLVQAPDADGQPVARAPFQAPEVDGVTRITGNVPKPGAFAAVRITAAGAYDLEGTCP